MLRLAAFADEISANLDDQIRVCKQNGVGWFELRGVNGINVMDFDKNLLAEIKSKLSANGMGVVSIGSPIGKIKITDPFEPHFEKFKHAVELAEYFAAPFIRIFSYYPPEKGMDLKPYRAEVMRRMRAKAEYVEKHANVTLVHENEKDIYGESGEDCLDLLKTVNHPKLRNAFDFANFVQAKHRPEAAWPLLKPYTVHIHIKDAFWADGKNTPAGTGDGHIPEILADAWNSGYRGFLTMEPHLSVAGQFSGFTGPDLFKTAVDALKDICKRNNIPLTLI
jgi:3-dehydroshikimate dehydratase